MTQKSIHKSAYTMVKRNARSTLSRPISKRTECDADIMWLLFMCNNLRHEAINMRSVGYQTVFNKWRAPGQSDAPSMYGNCSFRFVMWRPFDVKTTLHTHCRCGTDPLWLIHFQRLSRVTLMFNWTIQLGPTVAEPLVEQKRMPACKHDKLK